MAESLGQAILELSTRDTGFSAGIGSAKRQAEGLNQSFTKISRDAAKLGAGSFRPLETGFSSALDRMRQTAARNFSDITKTMEKFGNDSRTVASLSTILGSTFDKNAAQARVLAGSMTNLIRSGLSPATPQVKALATELKALQASSSRLSFAEGLKQLGPLGATAFRPLETGFSTALESMRRTAAKRFAEIANLGPLSFAEGLKRLGPLGSTALKPLETGFSTALESMRKKAAVSFSDITRTMESFGNESRVISGLSGLLGRSFDQNAARATLLTASITDLIRSGLSPAAPQVRALATELQALQRHSAVTGTLLQGLKAGVAGLGVSFGAIGIVNLVQSIVQTGVAFERLEARFIAVSGTAAAAQLQLGFIRSEADRLGISFQAAAGGFAGIAAAARETGQNVDFAREIFTGIAEAATAFQLSGEDMRGVLLAIQQIMSKGVVSSEELRLQIGDRLPGAFEIAARAMGLTTAELQKQLESGKLLSNEFLRRFIPELRNSTTVQQGLAAATETAAAAAARLGNAWDGLMAAIARSGPLQFAAALMERLAGAMNLLQGPAGATAESFEAISSQVKLTERDLASAQKSVETLQGTVEGLRRLPAGGLLAILPERQLNAEKARVGELQDALRGLQKVRAQAFLTPGVQEAQTPGLPGRLPGETAEAEFEKISKAFQVGSVASQRLKQVMGSSFDELGERANRLRKAIEEATEPTKEFPLGRVSPTDPRLQQLGAELRQTEALMDARKSGASAAKSAAREEESQAKRIADIIGDLGRQRAQLPALGAALGEGFSAATENVRLTEDAIRRLITSANLDPTSAQVRQLTEELGQLTQQDISETLTRQLAAIAREFSVFGDTVKAQEAQISAYRTAIEDLGNRLGDTAGPQVDELKGKIDTLEGSLARHRAAVEIGEAYRTFGESVQAATQQHQLFGDETQRVGAELQALQTLLAAVTNEFGVQSVEVQTLVTQINQLKVPSLDILLAPVAREQELFQRFDFLAQPFDLLQGQIEKVRQSLSHLAADPSIDLHSEKVQALKARYQELSLVADLRDIALEVGDSFSRAFTDAILGAESFSDAIKGLIEDITRLLLHLAITIPLQRAITGAFGGVGGGGGGDPFAFTGQFPAFQHGGSFTVGGRGGPDSSLVAFAATPGERVSVTPPGQSSGGNVIIQNFGSSAIETERRPNSQGGEDTYVMIDRLVARSLSRPGGASERAMKTRFGTSTNLIGR